MRSSDEGFWQPLLREPVAGKLISLFCFPVLRCVQESSRASLLCLDLCAAKRHL